MEETKYTIAQANTKLDKNNMMMPIEPWWDQIWWGKLFHY
jgi:hypothetical protein